MSRRNVDRKGVKITPKTKAPKAGLTADTGSFKEVKQTKASKAAFTNEQYFKSKMNTSRSPEILRWNIAKRYNKGTASDFEVNKIKSDRLLTNMVREQQQHNSRKLSDKGVIERVLTTAPDVIETSKQRQNFEDTTAKIRKMRKSAVKEALKDISRVGVAGGGANVNFTINGSYATVKERYKKHLPIDIRNRENAANLKAIMQNTYKGRKVMRNLEKIGGARLRNAVLSKMTDEFMKTRAGQDKYYAAVREIISPNKGEGNEAREDDKVETNNETAEEITDDAINGFQIGADEGHIDLAEEGIEDAEAEEAAEAVADVFLLF